MDKHDLSIFF